MEHVRTRTCVYVNSATDHASLNSKIKVTVTMGTIFYIRDNVPLCSIIHVLVSRICLIVSPRLHAHPFSIKVDIMVKPLF